MNSDYSKAGTTGCQRTVSSFTSISSCIMLMYLPHLCFGLLKKYGYFRNVRFKHFFTGSWEKNVEEFLFRIFLILIASFCLLKMINLYFFSDNRGSFSCLQMSPPTWKPKRKPWSLKVCRNKFQTGYEYSRLVMRTEKSYFVLLTNFWCTFVNIMSSLLFILNKNDEHTDEILWKNFIHFMTYG